MIILRSVYVSITLAIIFLLRNSFINNFDPLRIQIILFIGPYLTGYLIVPFYTGSYYGLIHNNQLLSHDMVACDKNDWYTAKSKFM